MNRQRNLVFAALAVLLVLGAVAGFLLIDPGTDPAVNTPDRANGKRSAERSNNRSDARPDRSGTTTNAGIAPTEQPGTTGIANARASAISVRVSGRCVDSESDPAAGITVSLLRESGGLDGPTATTNAEGEFTFEASLPEAAQYFVACLMPGKALATTATFAIAPDTPVEGLLLTILDQARVYGIVLQAEDRQPLEGVLIESGSRGDQNLQRLGRLLGRLQPALSGPDGRFAIESLAPGAHMFTAAKTGWTANELDPLSRRRQEIELAEFANVELLPFILTQAGIIEGRVLARAGRAAIAGASVELGTPLGGVLASTVSDAEGKYRFDAVPPSPGGQGAPGGGMGAMTIRARAPGFALGTRDVRVAAGETRADVDLLLAQGCTVNGKVVNHQGEPLSGAAVYYNDTDFQRGGELVVGISLPPRAISTLSNEQGEFTLDALPPGSVAISAALAGYSNATQQVATTVESPATVLLTLQPQGVIFGRVTSETGLPVAGAAIAAYQSDGPRELGFVMQSFFGEALPDRGENPMFPAAIRSAEDGSFRIEGLKAGKYIVIANAEGHEKHVGKAVDIQAGAELQYDIVLPSGGVIFGRVYDGQGRAATGVAVTAARNAGEDGLRIKTTYTDRNGNYELAGLSPGTYRVVRTSTDFAAFFLPNPTNQVVLGPGQRVQFDLYENQPGTARIYGRVTLDGNVFASGTLLLLGGNVAGFAAKNTTTDAEGRYEYRSVPLGLYQLAIGRQQGPTLIRRRIRVDRAGDMEVNLEFQTVSISGRVVLAGGEVPTGRVRVFASPVPPEGERAGVEDDVNELEMLIANEDRMSAEGTFNISGLSPGFYRVTARADDHGMVTRPYINARASVTGLVLQLPRESATLAGTVTGLDDFKPSGPFGLIAALSIEDEAGRPINLGGFDNAINLTQSKSFTVRNLAEGTYTVTLAMTGFSPVTHRNVRLTGGATTSLEFAFASSGNLRITIGNSDITLATAVELQCDIVNSRGEPFKKRFTFLDFFNNDGSAAQDLSQNAFVIKDLPPESYTITLKLPGFKDVSRSFVVVAGQTAEIAVQFEK